MLLSSSCYTSSGAFLKPRSSQFGQYHHCVSIATGLIIWIRPLEIALQWLFEISFQEVRLRTDSNIKPKNKFSIKWYQLRIDCVMLHLSPCHNRREVIIISDWDKFSPKAIYYKQQARIATNRNQFINLHWLFEVNSEKKTLPVGLYVIKKNRQD